MFLNLLEKGSEKALFLKLVYLIAIANIDSQNNENNIQVNLKLEGTPDYDIPNMHSCYFNPKELELLVSYAKELAPNIGSDYNVRFTYGGSNKVLINTSKLEGWTQVLIDLEGYGRISRIEKLSFANINTKINTYPNDTILPVAKESDSMVGMVNLAFEKTYVEGADEADTRRKALELGLMAVLAGHQDNLTPEIKKAILFELTALAFSDGSYDDEEKRIINLLYDHFDVDKELQSDFEEIIRKFSSLAKEAIDIISE